MSEVVHDHSTGNGDVFCLRCHRSSAELGRAALWTYLPEYVTCPGIAVKSPLRFADAVSGTSWSADETQGLTEAQKGSPVQDDWRAALAEALRAKTPLTGWQRDLRTYALSRGQAADLADALLPTVRRIVAAEVAKERARHPTQVWPCPHQTGSAAEQIVIDVAETLWPWVQPMFGDPLEAERENWAAAVALLPVISKVAGKELEAVVDRLTCVQAVPVYVAQLRQRIAELRGEA